MTHVVEVDWLSMSCTWTWGKYLGIGSQHWRQEGNQVGVGEAHLYHKAITGGWLVTTLGLVAVEFFLEMGTPSSDLRRKRPLVGQFLEECSYNTIAVIGECNYWEHVPHPLKFTLVTHCHKPTLCCDWLKGC